MKGSGFFRRVGGAALGLLAMGGLKPRPIVTSSSAVHATVPSGQTRAPRSQMTASQQRMREHRARGALRSYLSSQVIPPFKFAHGRTMVARYRAPIHWRTVG